MLHEVPGDKARKEARKDIPPGLGLTDSLSIKTTQVRGLCRGIDGGKKVKGRKRHIDTVVYGDNEQDSKTALRVIEQLRDPL